MKLCNSCLEEKPFSHFRKNPKGKFGLYSKCNDCDREYQRQLREKKRILKVEKAWSVSDEDIKIKIKEYCNATNIS